MTSKFVIEKLATSHDRSAFASGVPALDRYLQQFAGQDARKRMANCFVAIALPSGEVAGFYTLSSTAIPVSHLPEASLRRLPRYEQIPAVLIGRLAVDMRYRGLRLGEAMLYDAAERVLDSGPAAFALVVDAKDEAAASFYRRYGFDWLIRRGDPLSLFVPVAALDAHRRNSPP